MLLKGRWINIKITYQCIIYYYDVFQRTREFYNVCMTKIWNVPTQKSTREFVTLEKKKNIQVYNVSHKIQQSIPVLAEKIKIVF